MIVSTNEIVVGWKVTGQAELERMAQTFNKVTEEEKEALAELKKVNAQLQQTATEGKKAGDTISKGLKEANTETQKFSGSLKGVGAAIAAAFSIGAVVSFGKEIVKTTTIYQQFQKSIDFATGSAANGAKAFQFLQETANKYGLDLRALTEGYKGFSASSILAGTSMQETNRQFLAMAKASSVLGLSAEKSGLVLKGLEQIAGKGVVSMEELRGQIGDSLPGALGIAAKAMDMTTGKFIKFVSDGKLLSSEFLPRFADQLEKTFGASANQNLSNLTASQNRFNSSIDNLILAVGNKLEPFLKGSYDLAAGIANQLAGIGGKAKKESAEILGAKKAESDIAKLILKTSIDEGVWITRKRAATELLLQMDEKQMKALEDRSTAKENADKKEEAKAQARYDLLVQEEEALLKIAGIQITSRKVTEVDVKELKKSYDLRLQILEVEKQIRTEAGKLANNPNAGLAAERAFLEGKLELQKEFAGKGLEISSREIALTSLQEQNASKELRKKYEIDLMDRYQADKKTEEDIFKLRSKSLADQSKLREGWMKENDKQRDSLLQKEEDEIRYIAKLRKEAGEQAIGLAQDSVNAIFNIRQQALQNELVISNRRYDEEIRLADGNEQKINQINEKRAAKEKEVAMKQFRAQQMQAIANAAFQAAPYIVKYSAGLPFTAVNLGLTLGALATQTAFILSQPVPEFYKGVENFKGGLAMVGERGSEIIETNKGSYLSPDKPTLTYLPKGSNVITAPKTKERMQMLNSSMRKGQNEFVSIDTTPIARELSKMPVTINKMDVRGFTEFVRKGNKTTQMLNHRKGY